MYSSFFLLARFFAHRLLSAIVLFYFYTPQMKRNKRTYGTKTIVAAVFMIVSLLWLTVSIPFVNAAQQQLKAYSLSTTTDEESSNSDENNPFSNANEEKAESGSTSLSEYLHHIHQLDHPAGQMHKHECSHRFDVYVAFHGELLCPPPNFILS
jgi:type VI protein secretion system component VasK